MEDHVEERKEYLITLKYGRGRERSFVRTAEGLEELLEELEHVYHVGQGKVGASVSAID